MADSVNQLADAVRTASERGTPLRVRGGDSKDFYGRACEGEVLDTRCHSGVVDYEPSELVISVRAGTPLAEVEAALRERGQMLAFEPPHFGPGATIGGCVAAGLSGPRRASVGAVRDYVLGVRILDGRGQYLSFGGRVMKNVAGYDLSRLMAGSLGTLGVVLEVSFKVLPLPAGEQTVRLELDEARAIETMNRWGGQPLPITATCYFDGVLTARLAGAETAIRAARSKIGGEVVADGAAFWQSLRDHTHAHFQEGTPLWRLSVKSTTPPLGLPGRQLMEWGGALRWWISDAGAGDMRSAAARTDGHATLFRGSDRHGEVFHPLAPGVLKLHQRLKQTFDPAGILNPGRMYPGI